MTFRFDVLDITIFYRTELKLGIFKFLNLNTIYSCRCTVFIFFIFCYFHTRNLKANLSIIKLAHVNNAV